jgi:hypothetical protein
VNISLVFFFEKKTTDFLLVRKKVQESIRKSTFYEKPTLKHVTIYLWNFAHFFEWGDLVKKLKKQQ